jgi:hypothetical protein
VPGFGGQKIYRMVDCVLGARVWWTEGIFYDGLCQVPGVGEQEGRGAAGAGQLLQQRAGQPEGAKDKGNNVVHMFTNMLNESQIVRKYTRDAFRLFSISISVIIQLQFIFTQTESYPLSICREKIYYFA